MRKILLAVAFSLAITVPMAAQGPAALKKIDQEFVLQQFGDQFTLLPGVGAAVGDLDGDGVEDVVIAARCKNPMIDQAEHSYRVVDPYYDFFGYGDPRITTTFSEGNPALRGLVVLVIDGAGPDAWRSATPKAKYVIVNLPFKALSVRKMQLGKKKTIEAIYVEEAGDMGESSAVFFDGKKFRYIPMGGDMQ
ncbi:MAG: hypothetical protein WA172_17050 [Terriglobales bacterium]